MRSKLLLCAAAAAGLALLPFADGMASARTLATVYFETAAEPEVGAAEPEVGAAEPEGAAAEAEHGTFADHAAEECSELLAEGQSVDDCQKAPSPILPETNEIIWGGISFLLVVIALVKFAVPALQKGMAARTAQIAGDLQAAEATKASADTLLGDYKAQLADARAESNRIIDEARQQAEGVRKEMVARAEDDASKIRAKATEDLNAQAERLKADLQTHVKSLSLELAEKVVGANINNETNAALVDRYIAELSARKQ